MLIALLGWGGQRGSALARQPFPAAVFRLTALYDQRPDGVRQLAAPRSCPAQRDSALTVADPDRAFDDCLYRRYL